MFVEGAIRRTARLSFLWLVAAVVQAFDILKRQQPAAGPRKPKASLRWQIRLLVRGNKNAAFLFGRSGEDRSGEGQHKLRARPAHEHHHWPCANTSPGLMTLSFCTTRLPMT